MNILARAIPALFCLFTSAATPQPRLELPAGAAELATGNYQSLMLDSPCPFRVFSPVDPAWTPLEGEDRIACSGMRLVVYVMNLKGVPRPSTVPDARILADLIAAGFLVVTVDFQGRAVTDYLELQKDINGLFCMFGGEWHTEQSYFTKNRKKLLEYPGPNAGMSYTSFAYTRGTSTIEIPVNRAGIYVLPSGYTVEPHLVFAELSAEDWGRNRRETLFMDIVYPKASVDGMRVPILLEGSSTGTGEFVVNANTPILYSWLFNGYAFASFCYVRPQQGIEPQALALRYLQARKQRFSLSGKVGTAGISKACARAYSESQREDVHVSMPAVGGYPKSIWQNLNADATPLVLSWCHLNGKRAYKGDTHRAIQAAYKEAGLADKCLYFSSPLAGHEYDVYHLNEIMAFFDTYCK